MKPTDAPASRTFTTAVEAICNLCEDEFIKLDSNAGIAGVAAHSEIKRAAIDQKGAVFFRHFSPYRSQMVDLLAQNYRRFFKVALAHPNQTGGDPEHWAWIQIQPALYAGFRWIQEWYMLACEGENQSIRMLASVPVVQSGTISLPLPTTVPEIPAASSWRAPSWLFGVSLAVFGVGMMKNKHVPERSSEERLGESHTRLLLKGARRTLLWDLQGRCQRVRNEEFAAAGAIPLDTQREQTATLGEQKELKHRPKGTEGLGLKKIDLSRYMHTLTDKQELAFSLKFEYDLGLAEIASRMGLNRKTAYEHIEAAKSKIDHVRSDERNTARRAKNEHE